MKQEKVKYIYNLIKYSIYRFFNFNPSESIHNVLMVEDKQIDIKEDTGNYEFIKEIFIDRNVIASRYPYDFSNINMVGINSIVRDELLLDYRYSSFLESLSKEEIRELYICSILDRVDMGGNWLDYKLKLHERWRINIYGV